MSNPRRRIAVLSLAAALVMGLLVLPAAAEVDVADDVERITASDVQPTDEAWYFRYRQPTPPIQDEIEDPSGGYIGIARAEIRNRTNPFPLDTLHVGVLAGEPFARTYFGLSTFEVTDDLATITGGTLRLVDNGEDSFNAEAADMVACVATELVVAEDAGDWDAQPAFDCSTSSDAVLVEGSDPLEWEVDLDPFAEAFEGELSPGIAIVERGALDDDATPDPQQTWQVSFDATTRDAAELAPDETALIEELGRIAAAFDPDTLLAVVADPESAPTWLVLQVAPDVNAAYAQSRMLRQTDPDRELRPASADLELHVERFDLDGFDDVDDVPAFDEGAQSAGSQPDDVDQSDGGFDSGSAAFDAPAPAPAPSSSTPMAPAPQEVAVADTPANADVEEEAAVAAPAEEGPVAAPQPLAADGSEGGNPPVLLLLPLALGLAGALGWSLTSSTTLAADRRGGALDRLMDRAAQG